MKMVQEIVRLQEAATGRPWRKWGPYLSERQWGTVREDYSGSGDAWDYFSHDQARSRAYRWGEDGLAGLSDDKQVLCFALALWNGRDPILKERLFGLTNSEGNHGEDVKEYYFYLDSTPTHSYMRYLYKYPQSAYPYDDLVATNRRRNRNDLEYELLDTGVFNDNRYFDVFVEYAKQDPEDILIKITVANRGSEKATLHVLPTLWFRNTWSWTEQSSRPQIKLGESNGSDAIVAVHPVLGEHVLSFAPPAQLLFTENETNNQRVFGSANRSPYTKDAFHRYLIDRDGKAVNPENTGTKAAAHYVLDIDGGQAKVIRLRLAAGHPQASAEKSSKKKRNFFDHDFDDHMKTRAGEADEFYDSITPKSITEDQRRVMRQALAGMLWTKQYYCFELERWLQERGVESGRGGNARNRDWFHMVNNDVVSMPDKWEYPWFAAWDLAFHTLALSLVDSDFAKQQLNLMLRSIYLHPNGQIPAYEWNFSDVNPPVHAWAALFLYNMEQLHKGKADLEFLKRAFNKLMLNFTWWINRKDRNGSNVFEGGFLGLDNIGIFDRSAPLPTGGYLEQADGTGWMALFSQNMLEIAVELASHDPLYDDFAVKFCEHFFWIASAINKQGEIGLWDDEDGFYYDLLRLPDGHSQRLKVRSVVGLLPLCATTVIEPYQRERVPAVVERIAARLRQMPEIAESIHPTGPGHLGVAGRGILALVNPDRLRRILARMLDENEFLSPYGIRALSRFHADHPYLFNVNGTQLSVRYLPAESDSGLFGGNSNWRGPIWMPMNILIIRALLQFYLYYGNNFKIECPTGSGKFMNLFEVSREIASRLDNIFLRDHAGRRPVFGGSEKFQTDPHWRDHILFYEYFHGDNGAGIGASHQTGWTGTVAGLIHLFGSITAEGYLAGGKLEGMRAKEPAKTAA
jgi:hypothetical protein